jgi:antitoxin (DNA-binding transcriptional repressor) of toxin-antitoxin stability system
MVETVDICDARRRLPQLVDKAAGGEDVVVSRSGKPLARITRLVAPKRRITFGLLKGTLKVPQDFDAPLPADVQGGFEGH